MLRLIVLISILTAIFALVIRTGFALIKTVTEESDKEYTRENQ